MDLDLYGSPRCILRCILRRIETSRFLRIIIIKYTGGFFRQAAFFIENLYILYKEVYYEFEKFTARPFSRRDAGK